MKPPRGVSESSTTSDNTSEFIEIVKKYDVVYNTHNPDYKNVEVKMKVWTQIAEEIGLSVDASKRKWKNLRDSYTKYLRSFRIGTKTSKKYQFWAHADHMDFLKPFQGPGRNSNHSEKIKTEEEDTECDLGYQVLTKASSSLDEDLKMTFVSNANGAGMSGGMLNSLPLTTNTSVQAIAAIPPILNSSSITTTAATTNSNMNTPLALTSNAASLMTTTTSTNIPSSVATAAAATAAAAAALAMLPLPSLPTVQLPPQISSKTLMTPASIFSIASQFSNGSNTKTSTLPLPISSTAASSVGCLIIEPQLFASADTFKKELSAPSLGLVQNSITSAATSTAPTCRINPPLISKIRRVQPSPQTAAINLSFSAQNSNSSGQSNIAPAAKIRKIQQNEQRSNGDVDVSAILQANRDLDANTLFFLSLARTVRAMPMKFQSLAKMRCMRIVSDIELELENIDCPVDEINATNGNVKYSGIDSPSPPANNNHSNNIAQNNHMTEAGATEHFVYVMSPSRVESMIDLSSDEDVATNGGNQF